MSFSTQTPDSGSRNPAKKFIEVKSKKEAFVYYDKEKELNVEITKPFAFIVLDELSTITGYSKKFGCGFYSNEVHSLKKEPLKVRTFKGDFEADGLYADIVDKVGYAGGKFTKSLYVLHLIEKGVTEIVNLKLSGAAMGEWIQRKSDKDKAGNAQEAIDTRKHVVMVQKFTEQTNGDNTFNVPVFETAEITEELGEKATEADKELQAYFQEKSEVGQE